MTSLILRTIVLAFGLASAAFFAVDGSYMAAGITLAMVLSFLVIATFEEVA